MKKDLHTSVTAIVKSQIWSWNENPCDDVFLSIYSNVTLQRDVNDQLIKAFNMCLYLKVGMRTWTARGVGSLELLSWELRSWKQEWQDKRGHARVLLLFPKCHFFRFWVLMLFYCEMHKVLWNSSLIKCLHVTAKNIGLLANILCTFLSFSSLVLKDSSYITGQVLNWFMETKVAESIAKFCDRKKLIINFYNLYFCDRLI